MSQGSDHDLGVMENQANTPWEMPLKWSFSSGKVWWSTSFNQTFLGFRWHVTWWNTIFRQAPFVDISCCRAAGQQPASPQQYQQAPVWWAKFPGQSGHVWKENELRSGEQRWQWTLPYVWMLKTFSFFQLKMEMVHSFRCGIPYFFPQDSDFPVGIDRPTWHPLCCSTCSKMAKS